MSANVGALAALLPAYVAAIEAQGYAASTLASRRLHLRQFLDWCDARGLLAPDEITPGVLERYQHWLAHVRQDDGAALACATQSHKLTAVRMLLAWAARSKRITVNPAAELEMPKLPKRLPRAVLSVSEVERVLAEPTLDTALGLRDRAILEVLYSTGIRRMELVGLDGIDLDAERGALHPRGQGEEGSTRPDRRARGALDASVSRPRPADPDRARRAPSNATIDTDHERPLSHGARYPAYADETDRSAAPLSRARGDREAWQRAHFPPHHGDADARCRRGYPRLAGNLGARTALYDRDLYARLDRAAEGRPYPHAPGSRGARER